MIYPIGSCAREVWEKQQSFSSSRYGRINLPVVQLCQQNGYAPTSSWSNSPPIVLLPLSAPTACQICSADDAIVLCVVSECHWFAPIAGSELCQSGVGLAVARRARTRPKHLDPSPDNQSFLVCWWAFAQSTHPCVFPLAPLESIHCPWLGSDQSSSRLPQVLLAGNVFVFFHEWPEFISSYDDGLYLMNKSIMNHLRFLTGSSDKMNNSTISPSPDSGHSPQATPLAVRLENRVNLLGLELSSIVKRVKGISKCLLADRAEVTLAVVR